MIYRHQLPEVIEILQRDISHECYEQMKHQGDWFWKSYFSTLGKMATTTLRVLQDRVFPHQARSYSEWNDDKQVRNELFYLTTSRVTVVHFRLYSHSNHWSPIEWLLTMASRRLFLRMIVCQHYFSSSNNWPEFRAWRRSLSSGITNAKLHLQVCFVSSFSKADFAWMIVMVMS